MSNPQQLLSAEPLTGARLLTSNLYWVTRSWRLKQPIKPRAVRFAQYLCRLTRTCVFVRRIECSRALAQRGDSFIKTVEKLIFIAELTSPFENTRREVRTG